MLIIIILQIEKGIMTTATGPVLETAQWDNYYFYLTQKKKGKGNKNNKNNTNKQ
jgi:hypothetical protein